MVALPYYVVVSDMDGTLLSPDGKIAAFTRSTLKILSEKGVRIIFTTGRHYCDAAGIVKDIALSHLGYLVTSSGACVHAAAESPEQDNPNLIFDRNIEPDVLCGLLQMLPQNEEEVNISIFQGSEWKCSLDWKEQLEHCRESGFKYSIISPSDMVMQFKDFKKGQSAHISNPFDGVAKISFHSDNTDRLRELQQRVLEKYGDLVMVTLASRYCLTVNASKVTKWSALEKLLSILGVTETGEALNATHCVAFGDSMEDIEVLQNAGKGFVMGNGMAKLKSALPHLEVVASNTEEGAAKKLANLFSI